MPTGCAVTGTGLHTPPHVVTNEELCATFNQWVRAENASGRNEPLEESDPAWVHHVSGIERRFLYDAEGVLDPDRMRPNIPDRADDEISVQAEFACAAALPALAQAGLEGADIDLVIVAASNIQRPFPAIAIEVQRTIGANGFAFDMTVGCSSASFALQVASHAVSGGSARRALVCVPEIPSGFANFRARDTHFILGDASVAAVVEKTGDARPGAFEILASSNHSEFSSAVRNNGGFLTRCDPEHRDAPDKLFYQDGRRVFQEVVRLVPPLVRNELAGIGLEVSDVNQFWLHQANAKMNRAIAARLAGPEANSPTILADFANTAAAGALIAFHLNKGDLAPGEVGVLAAYGAGYTAGLQVMRRI